MSNYNTTYYDDFVAQGFKVGDLVTFTSERDSTGGVIHRIVEIVDPRIVASTSRQVIRKVKRYDAVSRSYSVDKEYATEYGCWDVTGKKLLSKASMGYARIVPVFYFFPTEKGKNPFGKNNTLIIDAYQLKFIKKVDIVELSTKYAELGDLIRSVVTERSK